MDRRLRALPFRCVPRNVWFYSGFTMFSGGARSAKPPTGIFVEGLDGDTSLCLDVARVGRRNRRLSVAANGGGSFIGAVLAKSRVLGATMWRDLFTHPRNIMCLSRKRTHEGDC